MSKFQLLTPRTYSVCDLMSFSTTAPRRAFSRSRRMRTRSPSGGMPSSSVLMRKSCASLRKVGETFLQSQSRHVLTGFWAISLKNLCPSSALADGRFLGSFCEGRLV